MLCSALLRQSLRKPWRGERALGSQGADTARVAGVLLVDPAGRLLLQLRDRDIEPGEDPEEAARREIQEESGLRIAAPLVLFHHEVVPNDPPVPGMIERFNYCAATAATQDEVICGEGEAILFVTPGDVAGLDMMASARRIVEAFIASEQYAALAVASPERCVDATSDG